MTRASWLYEAVGVGMIAAAGPLYRPVAVDPDRFLLRPGEVLACNHLSDADVPVITAVLYRTAQMWRDRRALRPAFAVRNDMFLPGFLAGYPPRLPAWLRRRLFPIGIGPVLRDRLRCFPIRFSDKVRLVEAVRACPGIALDALPPARAEALRRRAAAMAAVPPVKVGDVLHGRYADLLWEVITSAELAGPEWAGMWTEHTRRSVGELRRLAAHVGDGGALVIFPHGFPSPDGGINPLDPRAARLLHHLRPVSVKPAGLAFDPLTGRRQRAFVAVGDAVIVERTDGERSLLAAMRAATPVTAGLLVAAMTVERRRAPSPRDAAAALDIAVADAAAAGRPFDPELQSREGRAVKAGIACAAAGRLGPIHPLVLRAARTLSSALEPVR